MKKRLLFLVVFLVLFTFAGCGKKENLSEEKLQSDVEYYKKQNTLLKEKNIKLRNELKMLEDMEKEEDEGEEQKANFEDYVDIRFPVDGKYKADGSKFYEDRFCSVEIKEPITLISKGQDYFEIENGNTVYAVRSERKINKGIIYTNVSPYIEEITVDWQRKKEA